MKLIRYKKPMKKIIISSVMVAVFAAAGIGFWTANQQISEIVQKSSNDSVLTAGSTPPPTQDYESREIADSGDALTPEASDTTAPDATTYTVDIEESSTTPSNIEVTQRGNIISYTNKEHVGKNSTHLKGKVFQAVAEGRQDAAISGNAQGEAGVESETLYYIETDEGIQELSIEGVGLNGVADFDGQVVQDGDDIAAATAAITTDTVAAAPAVRQHKINILRIGDGGTSIATENQLRNIATAAGKYWVDNSNGYLTSSSIGQVKSLSRSTICSMTDASIFTLLLNQFGYTSLTDLRKKTGNTTLVIAIPGSCSKSYAGLAYTGTGLNDSGIVILRNSVSGILTAANGTSTMNSTYVDQRGAYNNFTLAHEMGHTFGLGHSGSMNSVKGWAAYNDFYSIMGSFSTYTLPKLDGYYRDKLGISTTANNEKVSAPLYNAGVVAKSIVVKPINTASIGSRYLKIFNPTNNMSYYVDYRSGNAGDNLSFYAEKSYYHIFNPSKFCSQPGITISSEATRYSGVSGGSFGAVSGSPNIARISSNTLANYDSTTTDPQYRCYATHTNKTFEVAGNFRVYVYGINATNGINVKIRPLNQPFGDISGSQFQSNITWMYQNGVASGNPSYYPNRGVTRGEMARFMYNLAGKPAFTPTAAELKYYSDLNGSPFKNDVLWAARNGVTTTRGTYHVNRGVTRGEMARFMYNLNVNVTKYVYY